MAGAIFLSVCAVALLCFAGIADESERAKGNNPLAPLFAVGVCGIFGLAIAGMILHDRTLGSVGTQDALSVGNAYEVLGEPVQDDDRYFCLLKVEGGEVLAVSLLEKPEGTKVVCAYKDGKLTLLPLKTAGVTIKNPLAEKE